MVVCSSRPHAVHMWEALRKHVNNHGYDLGVLVAFSGEVEGLTESKANGFPASETATRFDGDEFQIMVVAEKFQTGFDQPKLVAMYVEKTLTGLAAVQTLSRLNRIHPDKDGTFVLDFVNDSEDIQDAFAVYHGKTVAPPTDPNLLFDTRDELNNYSILDPGEMQQAAGLMLGDGTHEQIHAAMQPAVERFKALDEEDQDMFRDAVGRFVRVYGFLAQIVKFANVDLERDYIYCRALSSLIREKNPRLGHRPRRRSRTNPPPPREDLRRLHLPPRRRRRGDDHLLWHRADDRPRRRAPVRDHRPHQRTLRHRLDRRRPTRVRCRRTRPRQGRRDPEPSRQQQRGYPPQPGVPRPLPEGATEPSRSQLRRGLHLPRQRGYAGRRDGPLRRPGTETGIVANQQTCPIGDLLGPDRESLYLEYKSTLRWDIKQQQKSKIIENATIKTIAGFLNSRYGGTLLIGVADDGSIHGLEDDYNTFSKRGQIGDHDLWGQHLQNLIRNRLGDYALSLVTWVFHRIDGNDLARINVNPSSHPIYDTKGNQETFWHRTPVSTLAITDEKERARIIATRWSQSD